VTSWRGSFAIDLPAGGGLTSQATTPLQSASTATQTQLTRETLELTPTGRNGFFALTAQN